MNDTELINWLEAQLASKWKNSIFICQALDGSKSIAVDVRNHRGTIHQG